MDDKKIQKPPKVPRTQLMDWSKLESTTRQTALENAIEALKRRNPVPELLPEIEKIAKRLEERVFAAAVTRKEYLKKISLTLKELHKVPAYTSISDLANFFGYSGGENHGVVEPWRENTYNRLMAMRSKYTSPLEKLSTKLTATVNTLSFQGDHSNQRHIESVLEHYKYAVVMLSALNVSKDMLLPEHEEGLDDWEKKIVSFLCRFFKPTITSTSLEKDTQETISAAAPSLPTCNDQEKEPSFPPLVIPSRISPSSLLEGYNNLENSLIPQSPIQRLINAVSASSQHALKSAVDDMKSVTAGSRSSLGQEKEMWSDPENPRNEASYCFSIQSLRKEIEEVNQKLIDTRVHLCEQKDKDANLDSSEILIECVIIGVSVSADLKSLILGSKDSSPMLVEPLYLIVPTDYPKSSPIVLDELVADDISSKVRSKLAIYLGGCPNPITVSEIARTWDVCAQEVITEFAEKYSGGTFSSRYGEWVNR